MFSTVDWTILLGITLTLFAGLLGLLAGVHVLMTKRDSRSALAWMFFIVILPLAGPIIYLIFGINRIHIAAQLSYQPTSPEDKSESICEPDETSLRPRSFVGESIAKVGLRSCDQIDLLINGEMSYPAMLKEIDLAEDYVYCSTYIFSDDMIGRQFMDALQKAHERGARVRVIVDGMGGLAYPPQAIRALRACDFEFEIFNPITLLPPSIHVNLRQHRKILVVDGRVAFTGGQNISDRHLVAKLENRKRTRDLHFRITGKIVDEFERAFLRDWYHAAGIKDPEPFHPRNENKTRSQIWTRLIPDGPNDDLDKLTKLLVGVMSTAHERIWIMTPYFLPSFDLVGALTAAELRGVDVKIMLPARTNIHLAHWAALHNLRHILALDLKVYLQPEPFIHTKALLIDNDYVLVGSANMDARSLRLNFELVMEIFSESVAAEMEQYFEERLAETTLLDRERLKRLPPWMKLRNALAWLFSPYL